MFSERARRAFHLFPFIAIMLLSGCMAYSSGVMSMGPDTYTVSTNSEFGAYKAKQKALAEANEYAEARGKHMIPISTSDGLDTDLFGDKVNTYELVFRLVDGDDPEYQRTNIRKAADVVIETTENPSGDRANGSRGGHNLCTELTELDELRARGIISDAEFDVAKAKILTR